MDSIRGKKDAWITSLPIIFQDSDGEKSDDLVVDVSNEVSTDSGVHFQRLIGMRESKLSHGATTLCRLFSPGPGDSAGEPGPLAT